MLAYIILSMGNFMLKERRPVGRLFFNMDLSILIRRRLYVVERAPGQRTIHNTYKDIVFFRPLHDAEVRRSSGIEISQSRNSGEYRNSFVMLGRISKASNESINVYVLKCHFRIGPYTSTCLDQSLTQIHIFVGG